MQLRLMYVTIAVLAALVVAVTGGSVALKEGGRLTAAFRTGAVTFGVSLTLFLMVMGALGVVES